MRLTETSNDDGAADGYIRARAARELYQAQLVKIELDRRRGILIQADEVRLQAFSRARRIRDLLIALPERLSAIIAATNEPAEIRRILDDEMQCICQELADSEQP